MDYVGYIDNSISNNSVIMVAAAPASTPKTRMAYCILNNDPTANCQLALLKFANVFFNKNYYSAMVGTLIRALVKRLLMMDIKASLVPDMKDLIGNPGAILLEQTYTSTSGSTMCIVILQVDKIKNYEAYKRGTMK